METGSASSDDQGLVGKLEKIGRLAFDPDRLKERRHRVEATRCLSRCGVILSEAERVLLAEAREDPEYFGIG